MADASITTSGTGRRSHVLVGGGGVGVGTSELSLASYS
jgi:hypothetical protein